MPCPLCPNKNICVPYSGPCDSPHGIWVGEAPGRDEKTSTFQGKTGREVNEGYLPLAGLRRDNCRFGNAISCMPDTPKGKLDLKKQGHKDLLQSCSEWRLYPELESNHYGLIVPMGAFACYAIDKDISLDIHHGIPMETDWGTTFPMYHPAGGLHEPKKMLQIRTDWVRLRQFMRGSFSLPTDAYPNPDYQEIETPAQLDNYLSNGGVLTLRETIEQAMAGDTEITRKRVPFCITLSVRAGTGRLIRATNLAALLRLQWWLDQWIGVILFHNWLFDAEVCEAMGLRFPWRRIVDTMVKVFHLGNLPQGLKALAFRELGVQMLDFDDLVSPYSRELVLEYYRQARCEEWGVPAESLVRDVGGKWKLYKPQGFGTKLKRFWTDYGKNPEKDVFEHWTSNWEDHHKEVEDVLGEWPGKCVSYAPFDEVLPYACRDADVTLRLYPVLKHMESRVRRVPQEHWRAA